MGKKIFPQSNNDWHLKFWRGWTYVL